MKKVPEKVIQELKKNYNAKWIKAMLLPENSNRVLRFIEQHKDELQLDYQTVFFNVNGFALFSNGNEQRLFSLPTDLFPKLLPVNKKDAQGDWQEWLKNAKKIKEYL